MRRSLHWSRSVLLLLLAGCVCGRAWALRLPTSSFSPTVASSSAATTRGGAGVRMMPNSPSGMAILFDCDGVLADTERDGHRVSFNKVFNERGLGFEWDVDEYGRLCEVGGGKERMTHYMNANSCWPAECREPETEDLVKPKGLPVDPARLALVTEMHARKTALFQELIGTGVVPLRPGILRIVDAAIAGDVPLAVCSTSNEKAVRTLVETLMGSERAARFSFFCGDIVPQKKPQPDVYNLAAEAMGLDKSECVVVEDSGIGLQAAKAAGMACLVTMSTYTKEEDFTTADRVVEELGEEGVECITLDDLRALLSPVAA